MRNQSFSPLHLSLWLLFQVQKVVVLNTCCIVRKKFVYGSVRRESTSIIVQQDSTIYSFIIFSADSSTCFGWTLIHQQEHTWAVFTTSGTGRTVFATVRWREGVVSTPPRQRKVANTVRPVPDVNTVYVFSWYGWEYHPKHVEMSAENIIKLYVVASCWIIIDTWANSSMMKYTYPMQRLITSNHAIWPCFRLHTLISIFSATSQWILLSKPILCELDNTGIAWHNTINSNKYVRKSNLVLKKLNEFCICLLI